MYRVRLDRAIQRKQSKLTANSDVRIPQTHEQSTKCLSTYPESLKSRKRKPTITSKLRNDDNVLEISSEYGACSSASTMESNESGIQEDIGESIDDFIKELDNLEWSLCYHNEDSRTSNNSVDISTLFERMRCSIDEERKESQAFIESVRSWKQSDDVKMLKKLSREKVEERVRQEWFQKRFCRKSGPVKKSTSVSERLKRRKQRVRANVDDT